MTRASEVLALLLERGGMENLEVAERTENLKTQFSLSADLMADPGKGFTEVRATLADSTGKTAWTTRATPDDADWQKMGVREPMQCIMLLVQRLQPVFGLTEPKDGEAPQGKFARLMQERSGLPPGSERAAMKPRLDALKRQGTPLKLTVWATNAAKLAEMLRGSGLADAKPADSAFKAKTAPDPNEQKILWDQAKAFREHVRQNPPAAGYALYAEYAGDRAVHFIVCDRSGEWVIVDFQNDHHPDFQSVAPKNDDDCARLVVIRLAGLSKRE
jgi:hypothetical protein